MEKEVLTEEIGESEETESVAVGKKSEEKAERLKPEKKKVRRKPYEITIENDIKYRGPLSYRHLRILAWIFLAIAQAGFVLSVVAKIDKV